MLFERELRNAVKNALIKLYKVDISSDEISIQPTRKDFEGDLTVVVFNLSKLAGKNPETLGNELGAWLVGNEREVESFNVVKGFLNIIIFFINDCKHHILNDHL